MDPLCEWNCFLIIPALLYIPIPKVEVAIEIIT